MPACLCVYVYTSLIYIFYLLCTLSYPVLFTICVYLYMPVSNIGLDAVTIRYYTKQGFESRSHTSSDRA